MDSASIESELGMPVVNFGLHAGMQIDLILALARKELRSGDVVVMPLELELYFREFVFSTTHAGLATALFGDYVRNLSAIDRLCLSLSLDYRRMLRGVKSRFLNHVPTAHESGVWGPRDLNKFGDIIRPRTAINKVTEQNLRNYPPVRLKYPNQRAIDILRNFIVWCREHSISVYLAPSVVMEHTEYLKPEAQDIIREIQNVGVKVGVRYLGNQSNFIWPNEYFLDTAYHLNSVGIEKRTSELIDLLRPLPEFRLK